MLTDAIGKAGAGIVGAACRRSRPLNRVRSHYLSNASSFSSGSSSRCFAALTGSACMRQQTGGHPGRFYSSKSTEKAKPGKASKQAPPSPTSSKPLSLSERLKASATKGPQDKRSNETTTASNELESVQRPDPISTAPKSISATLAASFQRLVSGEPAQPPKVFRPPPVVKPKEVRAAEDEAAQAAKAAQAARAEALLRARATKAAKLLATVRAQVKPEPDKLTAAEVEAVVAAGPEAQAVEEQIPEEWLVDETTDESDSDSESEAAAEPMPTLATPAVGRWLLLSSGLVFAVIVVGGVTRLTESGLSITEWKPITGVLPPLGRSAWEVEFEKYKTTPEFKMLNHSMTLEEFKRIYYMEWGHRVLGRLIGLTFVIPLTWFAIRKVLPSPMPLQLSAMATLIGVQGLIGWYMVKSGLEDSILESNSVPRVSQYRLAAHLGTAFVLYVGMFYTGLSVLFDWRYAHGLKWSGGGVVECLQLPWVRRFKAGVLALSGLVFLTALSGAFVAGLDAGLMYNEFPYMGDGLAPPKDELMSPSYATRPDGSDMWWRNIFENPTTVQFDHRLLAMTTYVSTALLFAASRLPYYRRYLPPMTRRFAALAFGMANVQVLLGISTLLYLVPVSLAACHQAGSVALLTMMIHLAASLRHPTAAAVFWRRVWQLAAGRTVKS